MLMIILASILAIICIIRSIEGFWSLHKKKYAEKMEEQISRDVSYNLTLCFILVYLIQLGL